MPRPPDSPSRGLRRLHRIWPDAAGAIRFFVTGCVQDLERVLATRETYERTATFLLDSPTR